MENELQSISGTVDAVIYQNEDNGYAVIRLVEEDGEEVTAVGTMPQICLGEELMLTGHWTTHASYGEQFLTEYFERRMPATVKGIADYLSSGIIKGIGPKIGKKNRRPLWRRNLCRHGERAGTSVQYFRHHSAQGGANRRTISSADVHAPPDGIFDGKSAAAAACRTIV